MRMAYEMNAVRSGQMVIMAQPTLRPRRRKILARAVSRSVIHNVPAATERGQRLRHDSAIAAIIGNNTAIPGDDTIMPKDTAKTYRDNIAWPIVIFIVHR